MNLEDLRLLIHVVDEGSVQAAATRLGLSRTTLRRRLGNLEAHVGAPVLVGGPSGTRLTPAGEILVDRGRSLLSRAEKVLADARESERGGPVTIRLIVPVGMPRETRLLAIGLLTAAHPEIRLELREVEDPLAETDRPFDLLLHFGGVPPQGNWYSRAIIRTPMAVMASPAYLRRAGTPTTVESLSDHRILHWRRHDAPAKEWPLTRGGSVPVDPWLTSANMGLLRAACKRGQGLLLAPTVTPPGEPSDDLVPVLEDVIAGQLTIRTLSNHPSAVDSRVRAILDNVRSMAERVVPVAPPTPDTGA